MTSENHEELTAILQAVIDAPALERYFHPEQKGRSPLTVSGQLSGKVSLRKFGQPVVVADKPAPDQPYLEFTRVEQNSNAATVEINYPVEGLKGKFELIRDGEGRWVVRNHQLREG